MTTDTDAHQPGLGEFNPRRWLSHFVGAGGGYHVAPDGTTSLVWAQSGSTDEEQQMAKLMVEPGMLRAMTSALREDLTSDQLDLFKQHMAAIESRVRPVGEVLEDQRRRASKKNG